MFTGKHKNSCIYLVIYGFLFCFSLYSLSSYSHCLSLVTYWIFPSDFLLFFSFCLLIAFLFFSFLLRSEYQKRRQAWMEHKNGWDEILKLPFLSFPFLYFFFLSCSLLFPFLFFFSAGFSFLFLPGCLDLVRYMD